MAWGPGPPGSELLSGLQSQGGRCARGTLGCRHWATGRLRHLCKANSILPPYLEPGRPGSNVDISASQRPLSCPPGPITLALRDPCAQGASLPIALCHLPKGSLLGPNRVPSPDAPPSHLGSHLTRHVAHTHGALHRPAPPPLPALHRGFGLWCGCQHMLCSQAGAGRGNAWFSPHRALPSICGICTHRDACICRAPGRAVRGAEAAHPPLSHILPPHRGVATGGRSLPRAAARA